MTGTVFLGTPEAALPALSALASLSELRLVITQPDRPRGRSRKPQPPPVKMQALEMGIPVAQPQGKRALTTLIAGMEPFQAAVIVAYGQIITPRALSIPDVGWLNIHFSLLPRWRGAAPVAHALLADDDKTGVSLMRLDEGLDTGPVYAKHEMAIGPEDDRGWLTNHLGYLGAELLTENWDAILNGDLKPKKQDDLKATLAPKLTSEDRVIDITEPPDRVVARIRALSPSPGAQLSTGKGPIKILAAHTTEYIPTPDKFSNVATTPGEFANVDGRLVLGLAEGGVVVDRLQPPGKKPMSGADYLRGRPDL